MTILYITTSPNLYMFKLLDEMELYQSILQFLDIIKTEFSTFPTFPLHLGSSFCYPLSGLFFETKRPLVFHPYEIDLCH